MFGRETLKACNERQAATIGRLIEENKRLSTINVRQETSINMRDIRIQEMAKEIENLEFDIYNLKDTLSSISAYVHAMEKHHIKEKPETEPETEPDFNQDEFSECIPGVISVILDIFGAVSEAVEQLENGSEPVLNEKTCIAPKSECPNNKEKCGFNCKLKQRFEVYRKESTK